MTTTLDIPTTAGPDLSLARLHAMRGGYLLRASASRSSSGRRCPARTTCRCTKASPSACSPRCPCWRSSACATPSRCSRSCCSRPYGSCCGSVSWRSPHPRLASPDRSYAAPAPVPLGGSGAGRLSLRFHHSGSGRGRSGVVPDGNGGCGRAGSEHDHHPRSPALPPPLARHAPSTAVSTAASPPSRSTAPSTSSSSPSSRGATPGPPS